MALRSASLGCHVAHSCCSVGIEKGGGALGSAPGLAASAALHAVIATPHTRVR